MPFRAFSWVEGLRFDAFGVQAFLGLKALKALGFRVHGCRPFRLPACAGKQAFRSLQLEGLRLVLVVCMSCIAKKKKITNI